MTLSMGEALTGRRLAKETRSGIEYFQEGQHSARRLTDTDVLVSFVDTSGYVCMIPCTFTDDEWMHRGQMVRAGQHAVDVRQLPRSYPIQSHVEAIKAINKTTKKKAPRQSEDQRGASYAEGGE